MAKPISLQDVARLAGVHPTTVSMALRDHPRIPPVTRGRIRRIAVQLGYRPNPLLTALMLHRRARRDLIIQTTLGWLTSFPTRHGWQNPDMCAAYEAASGRAHELGFKLDPFWATEPEISPARFRQILNTRGITGVIISRLPLGAKTLDIDLAGLSAVGFGVTLEQPELHRVAYNHFDVVRHAVDECHARGYRRPGLALIGGFEPVDENRVGSYLVSCDRWPDLQLLPPYRTLDASIADFIVWLRRHRPDVILTPDGPRVRRFLGVQRIKVPRRIGVLALDLVDPDSAVSGFYQGYEMLGAAAVDLLVSMIYRNERGLPAQPQKVLIMGRWQEGATLRPRRPDARVKGCPGAFLPADGRPPARPAP